ncbi:MAG TPA: DUF934 domain-containing protein [Rhodocyclaceae bacterium]|nr:DUF934 domain-containing protein [Rhodocyclaceae bacterium]
MPKQLIKQQQIVADSWKTLILAENETAATVRLPVGPLIVPLEVWRARKAELIRREYEHGWALGVWLAPDEGPEAVVADLDDFSVVALHFPKFADGRAYSTARLLRERHGYRGELRAFGDLGQDQLFFLARVGFDAFDLRETGEDLEDALGAFASFPEVYQSAADQPLPLFRRRAAA